MLQATGAIVVRMLLRTRLVSLSATLLALAATPAQAAVSSNWAGYVAQRPAGFTRVQGTWIQPGASCTQGRETASAFWVGLGGFHSESDALEQIGTEVDCDRSGNVKSYAWYELVPDPGFDLSITVRPGDVMSGSVSVSGHVVRLTLANRTRGTRVMRTVRVASVDVSSADWIAEAPSACDASLTHCQVLPLANFGTVSFRSASATVAGGHTGAISDPRWKVARVHLRTGGRTAGPPDFAGSGSGGSADTSVLRSGLTAFTVSFVGASASAARVMTPGTVIRR
jgi:hypothetical protein